MEENFNPAASIQNLIRKSLTKRQPSCVMNGALDSFGKMYSMWPSYGIVVAMLALRYRSTTSLILGGSSCTLPVRISLPEEKNVCLLISPVLEDCLKLTFDWC